MDRIVTEKDFRKPEFIDANPEDYEFRENGEIVRKDRWEAGIRNIVGLLGMSSRNFDIDDVVEEIRKRAPRCGAGFLDCKGGKDCQSDHK
jgi:hypothetical protein